MPAADSPSPTATLHTGTQLVIVDVTVRDKKGNAVHGLKREDFVLSEAKVPQTLRAFDEYSSASTPVAIPAMPALPPGLFTNYTPAPAKGPLNVLLIDALNTPLSDQVYLRQQLMDYVKQLAPGTRLAIFGLADHLYMMQGFTSDPRVLQALFASLKTGRGSPLLMNSSTNNAALQDSLTDPGGVPAAFATTFPTSGGGSAMMSSNVQTFLEQIGVQQNALRIQGTIEAFSMLGHWLLNFPGRKNLVWFSAAFPLSVVPDASLQNKTDIPGEDSEAYRAMTNLLTRAQVSVYPVDPRGVQTNTAFDAANTTPNQMGNFRSSSRSFYLNMDAEHATMQAVASDTGGRPFYNANNLAKAVTDALEDGANYYTLAYTPSEHKTGGEWRSIHVELTGEAAGRGLELSYRRGYFADDLKVPAYHTGTALASHDATTSAFSYARNAMIHGAPTPQDVLFTTRVLPASAATEDTVAENNTVDPKNLFPPPYRRYDIDCAASAKNFNLAEGPNGHRTGAIEVVVFVYGADGKLLNTAERTLTLDLTPEGYATFQTLGLRAHLEVSAPARGESFFRIGVEQKGTGRIGAVEVASSSVNGLPPPDYASAKPSSPESVRRPLTTHTAPGTKP